MDRHFGLFELGKLCRSRRKFGLVNPAWEFWGNLERFGCFDASYERLGWKSWEVSVR